MAGQISEYYVSRPFTIGQQNDRELIYTITDTDDESEVFALLDATAPTVYQGLVIENFSADPEGPGVWRGRVRYKRLENNEEYTFNTGGGSTKITQSLATAIYGFAYGADPYGDTIIGPPNFNGAIGVDGDTVEGVDITVPQYEFSETHYLSDATVTQAYKLTLRNLTGTVNNASFKGFDAGEVLFMGASGAKRGDTLWPVTFNFAVQQNASGLSVGGITGITKAGWDYLWVRYDDFEDSSAYALVKRPVAAYVEQVYPRADFSQLGIGT